MKLVNVGDGRFEIRDGDTFLVTLEPPADCSEEELRAAIEKEGGLHAFFEKLRRHADANKHGEN